MQPEAWRLFRKLQNTQSLKNIERLNSIFQETTQNPKEQEFLKLFQIDLSKCRSLFLVVHVSEVRFEFEGLDFKKSKV